MSNGETRPDNNGIEQMLARLRANPLVPLLVAGAAVIALVAAMLMWASAPEYRVLYSNLSEADGGRIISELESRAVPYEFSQGGRALMVPGDQVHKLRLQLAEQGLPEGGNVGFQIMDEQAFGISQFAEQVNFQRGLQGELASSIRIGRSRNDLVVTDFRLYVMAACREIQALHEIPAPPLRLRGKTPPRAGDLPRRAWAQRPPRPAPLRASPQRRHVPRAPGDGHAPSQRSLRVSGRRAPVGRTRDRGGMRVGGSGGLEPNTGTHGLVGYDDCFTRSRSPVRSRVGVVAF